MNVFLIYPHLFRGKGIGRAHRLSHGDYSFSCFLVGQYCTVQSIVMSELRLREASEITHDVTLDGRQERQQGQNNIVPKESQHRRISFDSPPYKMYSVTNSGGFG